MESPQKKRRISSQGSQAPNASSTPMRNNTENILTEVSSISHIESQVSSSSMSDPVARKSLYFSSDKENLNPVATAASSSVLDLLEVEKSVSSLNESALQTEGEEEFDYDEFLKSCKRIVLKGSVWNLYKPIGDEEGSLYRQITTDPRGAAELADWFAHYCSNKPVHVGAYILFRLFFDCAGYQKFDLKKYFSYPPDFKHLLKKLGDEDFTNSLLTTKKFLFADNARLAKILKFAIYNFLQKFILQAHEKYILYGEIFNCFLKLLTYICVNAFYRPLVYTAFIFDIKILTAICMVKEKIDDARMHHKRNIVLDSYLNVLYICFTKVCHIADKELSSLKIACINELMIWIQYSANVFIDHYNCTVVLKQLLLDESKLVRLVALECCVKIIQNEKYDTYLKAGPIEQLSDHIWGRVCDIDKEVALKATEVFSTIVTHYFDNIHKKNIIEKLIEAIYHKDFRIGSNAGKCVIEILSHEQHQETMFLVYFCKLAKNSRPDLKPLLVESCFDHTNLLQNWPLIVEVLLHPGDKKITPEVKAILSELFLESVQLTLTGNGSKARIFSKKDRSIHYDNNGLIANAIYPCLKVIIATFRNDHAVLPNIFKILVKISPEYLAKDHCEVAQELIQRFIKFFIIWNNRDTLNAFLDYLVYANQSIALVSSDTKNAIEDLKKYVSEELYKSFKSKNSSTLIMAKKTVVTYSKFDLNEHIEWSKLLSAWTLIESNVEFIEDTLASCHWSLMWKVRKLCDSQLPTRHSRQDIAKEISLVTKMSTQFFSMCYEIMRLEDQNLKIKAFERVCESCINFFLELENVSKQVRALEVLKPNLKDDTVLRTQIMDTFEMCAESSIPNDVPRFRKYIMYIYQMACLGILPMDCLSVVFKYFDKYYDHYGKIIESILIAIREKNENWVSQLLVNTISLLYQELLDKHGVVDVRSQGGKFILSLSRKFHNLKKIMSPKIAAKLLVFAVNYASVRKSYDFLVYVRVFIEDVQYFPVDCKEILKKVREKVPVSDRNNDSVLYFVEHLRKPASSSVSAGNTEVSPKKVQGRKVLVPKLKAKGKKLFKTISRSTTESSASDHMSIHDSSSDNPDFTSTNTPSQ